MYSFDSTVRYSECNTDLTLSIPSIINYFQDCSTFHTESLGHGIAYCAERHFAWFVAAWQIQIDRIPRFTEPIRVSTWSSMQSATMAHRYFTLKTKDEEDLIRADSLWFAFDTQRGRAMRIPEFEHVYFSEEEPVDLPPTQRKIKLAGEGTPLDPIVVAQQHLDTNNHVNNGQYIAMADYAVRERDKDFIPWRLSAQYKKAAKLGNTIVPRLHVEEGGYAVDLTDGGAESFAIVRMVGRP